ncbi:SCO-spondin [Lingula anatina]|uniref:SCO-spondin n=1 Tax=Lingula anatina TaxID=7574 RepID=A0A1S3I0A4_LINAN|nr:SCO-spondin [Lingula anatina]|eukprot:XP_013390779.1 SCO-spondin [Lingula anatina]
MRTCLTGGTWSGSPPVCDFGGSWLAWGAWSSCSVICGTGTSFRNRICHDPNLPSELALCTGGATNSTQSLSCFEQHCPDCSTMNCLGACIVRDQHSYCLCPDSVKDKVGIFEDSALFITQRCTGQCKLSDPGAKVSLEAVCYHCDPMDYLWDLSPVNTTVQGLDWRQDTTTDRTERGLGVKPGVLVPGELYQVTANGTSQSAGTVLSTSCFIQMGTSPSPGICTVSPSTGFEIVTNFSVNCSGFSDSTSQLHYNYHFWDGDPATKNQSGILLGSSSGGYIHISALSVSPASENSQGEVRVHAVNEDGMRTVVTSTVQVC